MNQAYPQNRVVEYPDIRPTTWRIKFQQQWLPATICELRARYIDDALESFASNAKPLEQVKAAEFFDAGHSNEWKQISESDLQEAIARVGGGPA